MKNCHRDKTLDSLIGRVVKITFFDGTERLYTMQIIKRLCVLVAVKWQKD